jgi:hypothetical protein
MFCEDSPNGVGGCAERLGRLHGEVSVVEQPVEFFDGDGRCVGTWEVQVADDVEPRLPGDWLPGNCVDCQETLGSFVKLGLQLGEEPGRERCQMSPEVRGRDGYLCRRSITGQ